MSTALLSYRPHCDGALASFKSCGDAEIDKWVRNNASRNHESYRDIITCAFVGDVCIGFYALSISIEPLRDIPETSIAARWGNLSVPCLRMTYVAVDKQFQKKGSGTAILGRVIAEFARISCETGILFLVLTPLNASVAKWYGSLGFVKAKRGTDLFLSRTTAIELQSAG